MRAAPDFPLVSAPLLFDISPLTWLRQQAPPRLAAPRWPQYTVVLVEAARPPSSPAPAPQQLSELYFGRPGERPLSAVPARAQGQVLRFTDEFVGLGGRDRELLLHQLFGRAGAGPLRVPGEQATDMALLLSSMQKQAAGSPLLREDLLRSYLKTLLLYCTRLSQQQHGGPGPLVPSGLFGRFQQLLETHYTQCKSVAEYAAYLHVTANHLSVSVRKETGQPASAHIRQRLVLEAKRLVALRDLPLKEVAYLLGFEDVAHFSKLFKRCTGATFSDFKSQVRAQHSRSLTDSLLT